MFKEFIFDKKYTFYKCRNCPHWHSNTTGSCGSHTISKDGLTIFTDALLCYCVNYVPLDNLDYLEYLYNKKVKANV